LKSRYKINNGNKDYNFVLDNEEESIKEEEFILYYVRQVEKMKFSDRKTMFVDMHHIFEFDSNYEYRELILTEFSR
jgi:hypothetical protein